MRREIISVTWPAFIELIMSTLFGMVDMVMVGQISSASIAAVGLTNQPFMLLLAIFAAVNVGTTTIVAWNIGSGNSHKASMVTKQGLIINLFLGILLSIFGVFAAHPIVSFMGAEADTIKDATLYFQIVASGLVFQAITMCVTAALRGSGETRIPMYYNVGSNLLNVFGNYVLIYGKLGFPKLGVAGAAISTTFSRIIACLLAIYVIYSGKAKISIRHSGHYNLNTKIVRQIFSVGIPSALEQFVMQGALIMFARTVSGLGTTVFAAHQIGLNISGLTFSPSHAFGVAATTLVGQSLGANEEEKAQKYASLIYRMAIVAACIMGTVFILFSHQLASLYTDELIVATMAGTVLKILALSQPGQSVQLSLSGALRGAGDTMYPLYACIFSMWIFRVGLSYVFVNILKWGLNGAWIALSIDQYIRASIIFIRFRSGKWKYVKQKKTAVKAG
ncbi:MAG: MATE family efflux transporter [Clostridiaceae bacterium]|nr:MATE family efflux transporter [Clostridiaceae bacterium]